MPGFSRVLALLAIALSCLNAWTGAADWTRFRGPNGTGVSTALRLPSDFGPNTNFLWKIPVPAGSSSPIISGDRIWICGFEGNLRFLQCFELQTGKRIWELKITAQRNERKSEPNDAASSTPVTDGTNVCALFSGFGLACCDRDGTERWRVPLPAFSQPHGMSSSPIINGDGVIVLADQVSDSHIATYNLKDGNLKWRTSRPNFVGGYSTPITFGDSIVTAGPVELVAYSANNGERRWSVPKMGVMPISSPATDANWIFVNNGAVPPFESLLKDLKADRNGDGKITPDEFPDPSFKEAVLAIDRAYGNGDGSLDKAEWDGALKLMETLNALAAVQISGDNAREKWRMTKSLPDVASPLIYRNVLYLLKDGGLLSSVNPDTGEVWSQERIAGVTGRYFASPIAGDAKVFAVNESGKVAIIESGKNWRLLHVRELGESCYATPALAENRIVIRTKSTLWAFGDRGE